MRERIVPAGLLNTEIIGMRIRFMQTDIDRDIDTVTTAELRQINHNQGETTIVFGMGAEREATLPHSHPIVLEPPADYSDSNKFRGILE